MSRIELRRLVKRFDSVIAVNIDELVIEDGDFITLLGPSGCGKTTTLRCLSGLEEPEEGEIIIGDTRVYSSGDRINVPAGKRNLGMVFQNYALWPHMTVAGNISFGLKSAKLRGDEAHKRVAEALAMVGLEGYEMRYPHELSGGQQQRVAVARMLALRPRILLFDEPLSNLDAKLRMILRAELKRLHSLLHATSVYITHDQIEAMTLSTKIVVMNAGVIQQVGTPSEVYHFPSNLFVAEFMGNPTTNLLPGRATEIRSDGCSVRLEAGDHPVLNLQHASPLQPGTEVLIGVKPEDVGVKEVFPGNSLRMAVKASLPAGSEVLLYLDRGDHDKDLVAKGSEDLFGKIRAGCTVAIELQRGNVYEKSNGQLICSFGNFQRNTGRA
jgi:ABC-type sugar transport system ATPase subunit